MIGIDKIEMVDSDYKYIQDGDVIDYGELYCELLQGVV